MARKENIDRILRDWPYDPQGISVRKKKGDDGREVLQELKTDPALSRIPVIVLTTSAAEADILHSYDLQANCFITKPLDLDEFFDVVRAIEDFWLTTARLPAS